MTTTENTTWRDINGYDGHYQVSNTGRVRSTKRTITYDSGQMRTYKGRELKPGDNGCGYSFVTLTKNGEATHYTVHRLVMDAFLDDQPTPKHECNHIDGDKTNNHVENLEWSTRSENMVHAYENGSHSGRGKQKLNEKKVRAIRRKKASGGYSYSALSEEYGVSISHLSNVVNGIKWAHVE